MGVLYWCFVLSCGVFFFFKQKTAYEMRISDWSSDVCSSDLAAMITLDPVIDMVGIAGIEHFERRRRHLHVDHTLGDGGLLGDRAGRGDQGAVGDGVGDKIGRAHV